MRIRRIERRPDTDRPTYLKGCGTSRVDSDVVLNDLVASALLTGRVIVRSDGTPKRPLVSVDDMARAVRVSLTEGRAPQVFNVFNVGRQEWNFTVREIAENVARVVGLDSISISEDAVSDIRSYVVDFSAFDGLGAWHGHETFDECIGRLVSQYQRVGLPFFQRMITACGDYRSCGTLGAKIF